MSLRDDITNAMHLMAQNNLGKRQRPGAMGELQVPVEIHAPEERLTADPLADDGFQAVDFTYAPEDGLGGGMKMRQPGMGMTELTPEGSDYAASLLEGIAARHEAAHGLGMDSQVPEQGFYQPVAGRDLQLDQPSGRVADVLASRNASSQRLQPPQQLNFRRPLLHPGQDWEDH